MPANPITWRELSHRPEGQRVVFIEEWQCYPHFIVPCGSTAVMTDNDMMSQSEDPVMRFLPHDETVRRDIDSDPWEQRIDLMPFSLYHPEVGEDEVLDSISPLALIDPDDWEGYQTYLDVRKRLDKEEFDPLDYLQWMAQEDEQEAMMRKDPDYQAGVDYDEGDDEALLKARQRNTILAALRYWQWQRHHLGHISLNSRLSDILNIESNGGEEEPLTDEEIDELCEEINV